MAEERDPVELGTALGADSNMKEDRVTAKKRVKRWAISADASMEREARTLDQDEDGDGDEDEDELERVTAAMPISADANMETERDLGQLGMALGADSNRKEDRVTIKKWRADSTLDSSDSTMEENREPDWVREAPLCTPVFGIVLDANMDTERVTHAPSTHELHPPAEEDEDAEHNKLMDRRMHALATQGYVDGFVKILGSISSEKELQLSEILCQVSPRNNTCLHIAASFGHHDLAKYIVRECPDLIKNKNSKGDTALHIAARKRNLSFVKIVMDSCPSGSGASQDVEKAEPSLLRIVNKEGNTVLHEALINRCKQEEVVEILIKADPQVAYYPNKEGKSPLYLAAEAHDFDVVEAIGKSQVEERLKNRNHRAKPAVHGAIMGKNKGITRLLYLY